MGIKGVYDWPDLRVEHALYEINSLRSGQMGYEKFNPYRLRLEEKQSDAFLRQQICSKRL
jgi:hypothetical protein